MINSLWYIIFIYWYYFCIGINIVMNLLIVEDERMTREGLVESLDWTQIGVTKVFSAENGETGLYMAKRILPEIVLTDIRMPRMDGITMASRIREILPECRIIFLSAYSEIDYYKAAIDLKAIRYLDKPVEPEQLRAVITEAVADCMLLRRYKSTHEFHYMLERQKLADALCTGESEEFVLSEFDRLKLRTNFKVKDHCTAVIVAFVWILKPRYTRISRFLLLRSARQLFTQTCLPSVIRTVSYCFYLHQPRYLLITSRRLAEKYKRNSKAMYIR